MPVGVLCCFSSRRETRTLDLTIMRRPQGAPQLRHFDGLPSETAGRCRHHRPRFCCVSVSNPEPTQNPSERWPRQPETPTGGLGRRYSLRAQGDKELKEDKELCIGSLSSYPTVSPRPAARLPAGGPKQQRPRERRGRAVEQIQPLTRRAPDDGVGRAPPGRRDRRPSGRMWTAQARLRYLKISLRTPYHS